MTLDLQFEPQKRYERLALAAFVVGGGTAGLALLTDPARGWSNLLINGFLFLSVALGALFFLAVNYLTSAGWAVVLKRVAEAVATCLPLGALLILLVYFGRDTLYPWAHSEAGHDAGGKATYFGVAFFLLRMAIVLGIWTFFWWRLRAQSLRQDQDDAGGNVRHHRGLVRDSAAFVVLFALSFSLASFDWLMSMEVHWYSTIFAVYQFAGLFVAALAVLTLVSLALERGGAFGEALRTDHLHDLGKLLFAFTTFWAYIWFSQYMLIWYSNLPEEVTYFVERTNPPWRALFWLNLIVNWAVPFLVLLPRAMKRRRVVLAAVAVLLVAGRWLDLYLHVMPLVADEVTMGVIEVLVFVGYAGLLAYATMCFLARAPLLPRHEPLLAESLGHHT